MLKDYIYYMHIKDSKADGTVVPAGYGAGNIQKISKEYVFLGGRNFTMEPHLAVFDGLENLEKENDKSIFGEFKYENNNIAFGTASNSFKDLIKNDLENKRNEKRNLNE